MSDDGREAAAQARAEALTAQLIRANLALDASRAALAASEDRYRAVLESATDYAIITMDLAGRITGWNEGARRMLGWAEAEVLWRDAGLIWTPEDRAAGVPAAEMQAALETGSAVSERWHTRRDGTRVWATGQLTPLRDGDLRGFLKVLRDRTEKRAAEEALARSEARLRTLSETIPHLVWTSLADGRWDWAGPQWQAYTGLSEAASHGYGWYGAVHPDDRARVEAAWQEATARGEGGGLDVEHRVRRYDGVWRWFQTRAVPLPADDRGRAATATASGRGGGLRWFGTSTDVDDLKRAKAALQRSEERLARLLAMTPAAIVEVDAEGVFTYANPAAEQIAGTALLGRSVADPIWQPAALASELFRPDEALVARALRGETIRGCERLIRMADGKRRALSANAVPVRAAPDPQHPDGRITGALIAFTDITSQHEAQAALRRLNETLEAEIAERTRERDRTWTLSQDLLTVARFDTALVAVNPAWPATLGWAEAELTGRSFLDLVHPDDRATTLAATERLAGGLAKGRVLNRYRHRDGSWRWFAWTAVADDGLIYATGRDVTAEKEQAEALQATEEQLRQSQKMEAVGQLTGGIAHDFNNMLPGIAGSLELLERRFEQGRAAETGRYVEGARKAVDRAAALTQRLLAFARRQALQPRAVDADALVRGLEELIRRTVGPEIDVDLRLHDGGTWPVLCDPNQLESALLNLAINARDAMPGGGWLIATTGQAVLGEADVAGHEGAKPGAYVEVAVTDTGIGMSPDVMARAFEPFFTTKPLGQGTGLGLSQIYGFVRQSGGLVRLESAPGRGTTVRLFLPRHEQAHVDGARHGGGTVPGAVGAAETVLLVEGEAAVRESVAEHLRELGYRVLEAADAPAALRLLRSAADVDLLVTGVGLPGGLNGRQVADAARERRPDLPVLFVTDYAGGATKGALPAGMAVIGKPFALDALAERVRTMLREPTP